MRYLLFLLPISLCAADWNQWRGPDRNGVAPNPPPLIDALPDEGLQPLWRTEELKSGFVGGWSSPVVAGGKVYLYVHQKAVKDGMAVPKKEFPWLPPEKRTMSDEEYEEYEVNRRNEDEAIGAMHEFRETLYVFDAATGERAWTFEAPTLYTRFLHSGTPTVTGDACYVLGAPKTLRCIDLATRKQRWQRELPGEFRDEYYMSSVAVIDGVALFVAGRLFAVDAKTGDLLWEGDPETTSAIHTSVVSWKGLAIANGGRSFTYAFDPHTGKEVWRIESGSNHSTPTVVGDRLLTFGSSRKSGLRCYRLSAIGATKLWEYNGVADSGGSPVVAGGFAFAAGDRKVACVDLATGEEQWKEFLKLDNPRYTSLFAAGDQVFYPWGGLVALRAAGTYELLYQGMLDERSVLATREAHRQALGLDALEEREAQAAFRDKVVKQGTLECTNAAFADGRVYLRTRDRVVAYDLRK